MKTIHGLILLCVGFGALPSGGLHAEKTPIEFSVLRPGFLEQMEPHLPANYKTFSRLGEDGRLIYTDSEYAALQNSLKK